MTWQGDLHAVMAAFPRQLQPQSVEWLGSAGGFSGAQFWKLLTPAGLLCLRRWPPAHPSRSRLEYIHAVLKHVAASGFPALPTPMSDCGGQTYAEHGGHLWELTRWLPGRADYIAEPSRRKLASAMQTLATFHGRAASFGDGDQGPTRSPGLSERAEQLHDYLRRGSEAIAAGMACSAWPELDKLAQRILALFSAAAPRLLQAVERAAETLARLQPCIRDIRPEHVLFDGNVVSGIVNFGAMRSESVAADVARLLGGMVGDDADGWRSGIQSYQSIRPLDASEQRLVRIFDQTTVLLSGMNWLHWIYVEHRRFEHQDQVLVGSMLARSDWLASRNPPRNPPAELVESFASVDPRREVSVRSTPSAETSCYGMTGAE